MNPGTRTTTPRFAQLLTLSALLLASLATSRAEAQFAGAIFTTTENGTTVNANVYATRDAAFLNGGPQNRSASGLPDGTYYFQVTNPSGDVLLSSDPAVCRRLRVQGGVVRGPVASGQTPECAHESGAPNAANGSTGVRLAPFALTPNPGGEYKVWLIRQVATTTVDASDPRVLVFAPASAKTDNFKVREAAATPTPTPAAVSAIIGQVYYDRNTNGRLDANESALPGARVRVDATLPGASASEAVVTAADANGIWSLVFPVGTTYGACVVVPAPVGEQTWRQTGPLQGVRSSLGGATSSASRCWNGTVGTRDEGGLSFGLVALGAGGGYTRGFWSNRNGQRVLQSNDPAWRTLLGAQNLRSADGTAYALPTGAFSAVYGGFRTWLLDANATNMALMLSSQLAAMRLNVAYQRVDANARVYAGAAPTGCVAPVDASGFMVLGGLLDTAATSLASHGDTRAAGNERACQEYLKSAIDEGNNNRNFVLATPPAVTYP